MSVVKADIINQIIEKTKLPRPKVADAVEHLLETLSLALEQGKRIELRGFGVFEVRERKPGQWRDPRTGTRVPSHPKRSVRFKPSKIYRIPSESDPGSDGSNEG